jgi:predicted alternative tryptophan synthase beta-subunit
VARGTYNDQHPRRRSLEYLTGNTSLISPTVNTAAGRYWERKREDSAGNIPPATLKSFVSPTVNTAAARYWELKTERKTAR